MANTNANAEFKKIAYGDSGKARYESYMLLSTTYPLNTSDIKRMQIGLRASNDGTSFEPTIIVYSAILLQGSSFDFATWENFKEYMKHYLKRLLALGNQGRAGARPCKRCDHHLYHGVWDKGDYGD
ncbi:hypothetical protein EAI_06971 [Harpegnathos saltator]|uniref:Uncharacterized protein n=1 Tax=Harpegnathos saltator TaxID=610380 RepID=E2BHZ7_HARSA|nr:hypothetical protein EAI_06971 [Harpegnathos saltator]